MQVIYEPGGLIQERERLRSSWNIILPELGNRMVGRVESYWTGKSGASKWRTLDHWYDDFRQGYTSREKAVQELLTQCPRTVAHIEDIKQHLLKSNASS